MIQEVPGFNRSGPGARVRSSSPHPSRGTAGLGFPAYTSGPVYVNINLSGTAVYGAHHQSPAFHWPGPAETRPLTPLPTVEGPPSTTATPAKPVSRAVTRGPFHPPSRASLSTTEASAPASPSSIGTTFVPLVALSSDRSQKAGTTALPTVAQVTPPAEVRAHPSRPDPKADGRDPICVARHQPATPGTAPIRCALDRRIQIRRATSQPDHRRRVARS